MILIFNRLQIIIILNKALTVRRGNRGIFCHCVDSVCVEYIKAVSCSDRNNKGKVGWCWEGGSWVLDYITEKDWLENFFGLTSIWPELLNKENKQHSSIQGFHLYAKTSVAEPLRQQFHHMTITYGQCWVTNSMTTALPSSTADMTGRQRMATGWNYGFVERNYVATWWTHLPGEWMTKLMLKII